MGKVDKFGKELKKANLDSFGERREEVNGALGELVAVIARLLPSSAKS